MGHLHQLFSSVCGQNLDHSWAPGGIWLPFCQRCTGLYCGAGLAALFHVCLKPRSTVGFLAIHGGFLLLMVPFGFHWLPQGPMLRCGTGALFGFAIVAFLWLPLRHSNLEHGRREGILRTRLYSFMVCVTLLAVPGLGEYGGSLSFSVLTVLGLVGAAALSMLILANACLAARSALSMLVPYFRAHTP